MKQIVTLIALVCLIASCSQPQTGQQRPAQSVNTQLVTKSKTEYYDKYPATAVAIQKVELRSEVSGFIKKISFAEGAHVEKGQVLYTIDQSKYLAARDQAKATLASAKSTLKQAELDAKRYNALGDQDAIAKQQVEVAETNLENAKQQVASAEAALVVAQTNLNYTTVRAPFDGIIGISDVRLGAYIVAGQTLLNTISSSDPMGVDFEVNETEISRFLAMQNNPESYDSTAIRLELPNGEEYPIAGKVAIIDRGVNSQTGTIKVRLSFDNASDLLRDGMTLVAKIKNNSSGENLIIPFRAVAIQLGEYFVFTIENGTAKQIRITPGKEIGDKLIVKGGLNAGQEIIVDGIQQLRNGMPVQKAQ